MTIGRRKLTLEGVPEQETSGQKQESLADSSVAKARIGLEDIEARPSEYFYYPFDYELFDDFLDCLGRPETKVAAMSLLHEKIDLLGKIKEKFEDEFADKQIELSGGNLEALRTLIKIIRIYRRDKK